MITGTYKSVRYEEVKLGEWRIRWPSGIRVTVLKPDEESIKAMIDGAFEQAPD